MVSAPSSVSTCDLARNYNGFSAVLGIHVRFSKELQWFFQIILKNLHKKQWNFVVIGGFVQKHMEL